MTDWFVLDRTARTISGPHTQAEAEALADATHTINTDHGYLEDLKNELDDAAESGGEGGGGLTLAEIQAALDDGSLVAPGGGGGGSTVVHQTAVTDQVVPAAAIPTTGSGFPAVLPNTPNPLWRITGPGLFGVGMHYEVNQLGGDGDSFQLALMPEVSGNSVFGWMGMPTGDARPDRFTGDIVDANWTRYRAWNGLVYLGPGQHVDWHLEISGHSTDFDTPVAGGISFRDLRVFAIKLDTESTGGSSPAGGHDWISNGDTNGIFYALGQSFGGGTFANPAGPGGPVTVTESGIFAPWDPPPHGTYLTDRDSTVNVMLTIPDGEGNWVMWDFGPTNSVRLREYTVRSRWDQNVWMPTAWLLEGSNDGSTWAALDAVTAAPFSAMDQWQHFNVDNANMGPYRYIRILDTADAHLALGEVELYGDLV
jgi:hypothetical protein